MIKRPLLLAVLIVGSAPLACPAQTLGDAFLVFATTADGRSEHKEKVKPWKAEFYTQFTAHSGNQVNLRLTNGMRLNTRSSLFGHIAVASRGDTAPPKPPLPIYVRVTAGDQAQELRFTSNDLPKQLDVTFHAMTQGHVQMTAMAQIGGQSNTRKISLMIFDPVSVPAPGPSPVNVPTGQLGGSTVVVHQSAPLGGTMTTGLQLGKKIAVPDVRGKVIEPAIEAIKSAGFTVAPGVERVQGKPVTAANQGKVDEQNPAPGTLVAPNATIKLKMFPRFRR